MYLEFGSVLQRKNRLTDVFSSNFSSGGCFVLLSGTVCAILLEGIMRKMCSIILGPTSRPDAANVKMTAKTEYDQEIPQSHTADQPMAQTGRVIEH